MALSSNTLHANDINNQTTMNFNAAGGVNIGNMLQSSSPLQGQNTGSLGVPLGMPMTMPSTMSL